MALLDPLRHLKHRAIRVLGYRNLVAAARQPTPMLIQNMRTRLGIQLSEREIMAISAAIMARSCPRLLVFGTGHDSEYWHRLNINGLTVFLEDDLDWIARAKKMLPNLNIQPIAYGTKRKDWRNYLEDAGTAFSSIPEIPESQRWDVVLVDGPRGYDDLDPGRMKSIYFASQLAEDFADVFVHDCNREVEQAFCDRYFSEFELVSKVDRLRHYQRFAMRQST